MGTGYRHIVARHLLSGAILMALALVTVTEALRADPHQSDRPFVSTASQERTLPTRPGARLLPNPLGTAVPAIPSGNTEWPPPPGGDGMRGGAIPIFDNGNQLDDFGDNASQLSLIADGNPTVSEFSAAVADDFILPESLTQPGANYQITTIRAPFALFIFNLGIDPNATPTNTWTQGAHITIYGNSLTNSPGGVPNGDGTFSGDVIQTVQIMPGGWTETFVDGCRPCYVVDFPVNFVLQANTRYWLSIVPRHPTGGDFSPTQSAWCLSELNNLFFAQWGASFDLPFWNDIAGNDEAAICTNPPPIGTLRGVSFQIFGSEVPPTSGACCDTATSLCTDVSDPMLCAGPSEVFHPSEFCQFLSPPCNLGACCLSDGLGGGLCMLMTEADCIADPNFIDFTPDVVCPINCAPPPPNDDCAMPIALVGPSVSASFDSTRATIDPTSPTPTCGAITQDIWYSYNASCSGTVVITTLGSSFDTLLTVYGNNTSVCPPCPTDNTAQLDCNDDFDAATTDSHLIVPVMFGDCLLIRVGGNGFGATGGPGMLTIDCVNAGLGACCDPVNQTCTQTMQAGCLAPAVFHPGDVCSDLNCPPAPLNDDCIINAEMVTGDALIIPFNTTLATIDGPPGMPPACTTALAEDVWFGYTATCTGTLTLSMCGNTNYDAAIEVYDGCSICPTDFTSLIACDDNGCGAGGESEVVLPVVSGNCYLLRIGGANGAVGGGMLSVTCNATAACCPGDLNADNLIDINDSAPLVAALLNPPMANTPAFCAADVNADAAVNGLDIQTFVDQILSGATCLPLFSGACCFSDGTCTLGAEADCFMAGGLYQGNDTLCTPNLCPQPPVNDACIDALALPCNTQMTINNLLATSEPTDPMLSCRFPVAGPGIGTVWFTFVATDADALITTCNSAAPVTDTILTVYDAVCPVDMTTEIACSEDAGGACGRLSQVCVTGLIVGNSYTILAASFDDASRGDITIELTCPCPFGACCLPDGTCTDLRSDQCLAAGGAFQGNGVSCAMNPCITPPDAMICCTGDLDGSGIVDLGDVAGFVAALLNPPLFGSPDFCHADINADLVVDGNDIAGLIPLVIAGTPCTPPTNDACINAQSVVCGSRVIVDNTLATLDAADPAFSCRAGGPGQGVGSLWFTFVATNVTARISTCGSINPANDTILAVYDGASCAMLGAELGCSEDVCGRLSDLCVSGLTPGNTYLVQVASFDEATRGFISVEVTCPCP